MRRDGLRAWRGSPERLGDEDMPPTGEDAREQRRATSMPIVWLGLCLVVAAAFTAAAGPRFGLSHASVAGASACHSPPTIAPTKVSQ
jgi:hypothetical protein